MIKIVITIAALLAGLASGPAWAQGNLENVAGCLSAPATFCGVSRDWEITPHKNNLYAAWQECEKHGGASGLAGSDPLIWNHDWDEAMKGPCQKIRDLILDRYKRRVDAEAKKQEAEDAKDAKDAAIRDKATLPIIHRGLTDPDGKPTGGRQ